MATSALRVLPGLALACLLAAAPGPRALAGDEEEEKAAAMAMHLFVKQCASCHAVPDPALATGRAWIDQVHRTAWSDTPAGAREALVAWLGAAGTVRPAAAPAAGEGRAPVAASFDAGSAVLEGKGGAVRVVLVPDGKERPALEPGPWRLGGTWIERVREGKAWYLSASGPAAPAVEAKAGEPFPLEVSAEVRFKGHARRRGGNLELGFDLKGDRGRGVSLWRAGKRIKVGYKVLGAGGTVLAEGDMTWGWGGGGWARVGPEAAAAEAVEYTLDAGPFPMTGDRRVPLETK